MCFLSQIRLNVFGWLVGQRLRFFLPPYLVIRVIVDYKVHTKNTTPKSTTEKYHPTSMHFYFCVCVYLQADFFCCVCFCTYKQQTVQVLKTKCTNAIQTENHQQQQHHHQTQPNPPLAKKEKRLNFKYNNTNTFYSIFSRQRNFLYFFIDG